jgi:hypothetical protein
MSHSLGQEPGGLPRSDSQETLSDLPPLNGQREGPRVRPPPPRALAPAGALKDHKLFSMFSTRDLSLHVFTHDDVWKPVLFDVNATIVPSRLTALMGPSGAGTTPTPRCP